MILLLTPPAPALAARALFDAAFERLLPSSSSYGTKIADVNGDGHPDLVTYDAGGNIVVFLGRGDGSFQAPIARLATPSPTDVAVGDLDGDGRPDAVVVSGSSGNVVSLRGNGDGTFAPVATFNIQVHVPNSTNGPGPFLAAIADLDGDGFADLVMSVPDSGIVICQGRGNWTFGPPRSISHPGTALGFAIGDLNRDGRPDVAEATMGPVIGGLVVHLNDGGGSFHDAGMLDTSYPPSDVTIADLNGDGYPDLVMPSQPWQSVVVMLGNGDGTFRAPVSYDIGSVESPFGSGFRDPYPTHVAVGDFNGDGVPDIAETDYRDETLGTVFLGRGDGTLSPPVRMVGLGLGPIAAIDIDRDGRVDLVGGKEVCVAFGNGDGTFGGGAEYDAGQVPSGIAAADLGRDGILDLIVADQASDSVTVLSGSGSGTFARRMSLPAGQGPIQVSAGDLNGDGWPDLAIVNSTPPPPGSAQGGAGLSIELSDGAGGFQSPLADPSVALPAGAVWIADINRDGRPDLLLSTSSPGDSLIALLGGPDFPHGGRAALFLGFNANSIESGDADADGRADVALAGAYAGGYAQSAIALGDGTGGFRMPMLNGSEGGSVDHWAAFGDFNGDGIPDLVALNNTSGPVEYFGPAVPGWIPRENLPQISGLGTIADFDGDGIDDLAMSNWGSPCVSVFFGARPGGLGRRIDFAVRGAPYALVTGDFNGDGQPDLAVTEGDNRICILLNQIRPVVTAVSLSFVSASVTGDGVNLDWYTALGSGASGEVDRHMEGSGWIALGSVAADGTGHLRYLDRGVAPGTYQYRLTIAAPGGFPVVSEADVQVPASALFALEPVHPNPTPSLSGVAITLPDAQAARLELLDVAGRVVFERQVGTLGAGRHVVALDGSRALRDGVYLMRLDRVGKSVTRRVVILK